MMDKFENAPKKISTFTPTVQFYANYWVYLDRLPCDGLAIFYTPPLNQWHRIGFSPLMTLICWCRKWMDEQATCFVINKTLMQFAFLLYELKK